MRGHCGAHGFPSRRHHSQTIDEQLWQGAHYANQTPVRSDLSALDRISIALEQSRLQGYGLGLSL